MTNYNNLKFAVGSILSNKLCIEVPLRLFARHISKTSVLNKTLVDVSPKEALLDNPPTINVDGLEKNQKVTLWNTFIDDSGLEFSSHAHYVANDEGKVDVKNSLSYGGKYSGIFPEGLVASMHTAPPVYKKARKLKWARLFKKNVEQPMVYNLKVLDGHQSEQVLYDEGGAPEHIGATSFTRHLMTEGVKREEVKDGNLRGVLFTPPGSGPFPAVLDLFGAESGIKEFRSAMLASYGYASLVLPYYSYKDLPALNITNRINLDYFLEAIDFLSSYSSSPGGGVGLIGSSKGGEIGLTVCSLTDKVKACITINSYNKTIDMSYYLKGNLFQEAIVVGPKNGHVYLNKEGQLMAIALDEFYHWDYPGNLPVDKIPDSCHVLMAASDQDGGHGHRSAIALKERARKFDRANISATVYPGAGHLLDPPFHSHIEAVWNSVIQIRKPDGTKFKGLPHYYGGNPLGATEASKDLWKRTLALFHKRLVQDEGLPLNTCKLTPPYL